MADVLDLEEYRARLMRPEPATVPREEAALAIKLAYARGLREGQLMGIRKAEERAAELEREAEGRGGVCRV